MIPLLLNILQWYIGIGIGVVLSLVCVTKGLDGFSYAAQNTVFKNRVWLFVFCVWLFIFMAIVIWPVIVGYDLFFDDEDDDDEEE